MNPRRKYADFSGYIPTMESYEAANRRELATVETFMG
jgi:hypothetical protein